MACRSKWSGVLSCLLARSVTARVFVASPPCTPATAPVGCSNRLFLDLRACLLACSSARRQSLCSAYLPTGAQQSLRLVRVTQLRLWEQSFEADPVCCRSDVASPSTTEEAAAHTKSSLPKRATPDVAGQHRFEKVSSCCASLCCMSSLDVIRLVDCSRRQDLRRGGRTHSSSSSPVTAAQGQPKR